MPAPRPRLRLVFVAAVLLAGALPASTGAEITLETGELDGARYTLARPARWNGGLLLLAHGYRAPDRPLIADLYPERLARRTLLEEGWMVAKTSYRRNGLVIGDAIADLDALRAHVAKTFGEPARVLLEGESMGGLIVTLIAERTPEVPPRYHGAIALGAALHLRETGSPLGLSLQPNVPLLFVSNRNELEGPRRYVAAELPREPTLRPVLFRVERDGHVNLNQHERLAALRAMNGWLDRGRLSLPRPPADSREFDATVPPPARPSAARFHADGRGFDVRVVEVTLGHGNVLLDAQPADFAAAGIGGMTYLQLRAGDRTFRVRHARDFGDVPRGDWVVFPNADGYCWLARNREDAAATAGLAVGATVTLRRYDPARE